MSSTPTEVSLDNGPDTAPPTDLETLEANRAHYLESGWTEEELVTLEAMVRDGYPLVPRIATDGSLPRFATRRDQDVAVAFREHVTRSLTESGFLAQYQEEFHEKIVTTLFEGRTADEPPVVPTDVRIHGRLDSEIGSDEGNDLLSYYQRHLEDNWGL